MHFRKFYKQSTGLVFNEKTHIHHINRNRKDNSIVNLVHIDQLSHYRFHRYMDTIIGVEGTLTVNNWTITDLKNDSWIRSFCIPFKCHKLWIKRLLSAESKMLNNIKIRNEKAGINKMPVLITDYQRKIIEIYKNIL